MNYWVLKGRPDRNDWDTVLEPERKQLWRTKKPPKLWAAEDRLFCWESSPQLRIIALAELGETNRGEDEHGQRFFEVRFLTRPLPSMLGIEELRRIPVLNQASFLKAGAAGTVFPLKFDQADILLRVLCTRNPELRGIWPDVEMRPYEELIPDIDYTFSGREGSLKLVLHFLRERNRGIVEAKKQEVLKACGHLECEACGFNFEIRYGARGRGFCEVHHRLPLAEVEGEVETKLEELAVVCSNCHRMLHNGSPWLKVEELKLLISEVTQYPAEPLL